MNRYCTTAFTLLIFFVVGFVSLYIDVLPSVQNNSFLGSAFAAPINFDCTAVSELPQSECEALVALYDNTNGEG